MDLSCITFAVFLYINIFTAVDCSCYCKNILSDFAVCEKIYVCPTENSKYIQVNCWIKKIVSSKKFEQILIKGDCNNDSSYYTTLLCNFTDEIVFRKNNQAITCNEPEITTTSSRSSLRDTTMDITSKLGNHSFYTKFLESTQFLPTITSLESIPTLEPSLTPESTQPLEFTSSMESTFALVTSPLEFTSYPSPSLEPIPSSQYPFKSTHSLTHSLESTSSLSTSSLESSTFTETTTTLQFKPSTQSSQPLESTPSLQSTPSIDPTTSMEPTSSLEPTPPPPRSNPFPQSTPALEPTLSTQEFNSTTQDEAWDMAVASLVMVIVAMLFYVLWYVVKRIAPGIKCRNPVVVEGPPPSPPVPHIVVNPSFGLGHNTPPSPPASPVPPRRARKGRK